MDDSAQQPTQQPAVQSGVARPVAPPVHDPSVVATTPPITPEPTTISGPSIPAGAVSPRNHEQAPIQMSAPSEELPNPTIEASTPSVEISADMQDAGVEHGPDAKEHELPEEVKKIGVELAKEATPVVPPAQTPPAHVEKSFEETLLAAKASKSSNQSLSFLLRLMLREWKKKMFTESGEVPK